MLYEVITRFSGSARLSTDIPHAGRHLPALPYNLHEATMIVVATWPLMLAVQARLRGRRPSYNFV